KRSSSPCRRDAPRRSAIGVEPRTSAKSALISTSAPTFLVNTAFTQNAQNRGFRGNGFLPISPSTGANGPLNGVAHSWQRGGLGSAAKNERPARCAGFVPSSAARHRSLSLGVLIAASRRRSLIL